jgi:hypothetical protein
MTRIEVFSDAAFAFAVTMLVIFMSSLGYLAGILFGLSPIAVFILTHSTRKQIRAINSDSLQ